MYSIRFMKKVSNKKEGAATQITRIIQLPRT